MAKRAGVAAPVVALRLNHDRTEGLSTLHYNLWERARRAQALAVALDERAGSDENLGASLGVEDTAHVQVLGELLKEQTEAILALAVKLGGGVYEKRAEDAPALWSPAPAPVN